MIGLLIVVAKLLEGVFKRFGLNSIIAYATTGVILGPVTGLVEAGTEVEVVLSIGIFIFFFLIGLEELDIRGFFSVIRGRLFLASVLSVTISLLVSLAVTTDTLFDLKLDLDFTQTLGLAGVLSLSSPGVVTKVLPKIIVALHHFLQVPQLSFGVLLGGLFLVVVAAEHVGLHGSLGALLFGAALSMLPY